MSFEVEGKIIALYKLGFIYLTLKIYCVKTLVLVIISNRKWFILLSPCLSALDFRIMDFGVYFKLEKKIKFKTNWIFFQFRNWFLFLSYFSSFSAMVKWFGGPCSPILSLTMLQGCVPYQFPIRMIHNSLYIIDEIWNVKKHLHFKSKYLVGISYPSLAK